MRVSPLGLLAGGIVAGGTAEIVATQSDSIGGRHPGPLFAASLASGSALAGGGLIGAMSLEHVRGPYVERFAVDAAERIAPRTINLNWATRSGRWGALACGIGLGLMNTLAFSRPSTTPAIAEPLQDLDVPAPE